MKTVLHLALRSLLNRKATVALTGLSIGLSVMLLLGVERVRSQARDSFTSTVAGTDLIVGARGSATQILLFSVFNIGFPSKNFSPGSADAIAALPGVAWTIPLSMGDTHRGFWVVGTSDAFFKHFRFGRGEELELAAGEAFVTNAEAVLGAAVAAELDYTLGSQLVVSHGSGDISFVEHDAHPFTVTGVLERTGTPVDRQVLVSLHGIDAMHADFGGDGAGEDDHDPLAAAGAHTGHDHGHDHDHVHGEHCDHSAETALSALLVGLDNRAAALSVQRVINAYEDEPLTAVLPGVALQELWTVLGSVENTLLLISAFVVLVGMAGMLTTLLTSLNERRREMAILRSVGARPATVFSLMVGEAVLVTAAAVVLGVALLYAGLTIARPALQEHLGIFLSIGPPAPREWALIGLVLLAGTAVGLVPAWRIYRLSLADGVTPRI